MAALLTLSHSCSPDYWQTYAPSITKALYGKLAAFGLELLTLTFQFSLQGYKNGSSLCCGSWQEGAQVPVSRSTIEVPVVVDGHRDTLVPSHSCSPEYLQTYVLVSRSIHVTQAQGYKNGSSRYCSSWQKGALVPVSRSTQEVSLRGAGTSWGPLCSEPFL
jgi:hypothetical protein